MLEVTVPAAKFPVMKGMTDFSHTKAVPHISVNKKAEESFVLTACSWLFLHLQLQQLALVDVLWRCRRVFMVQCS